MDIQTNSKINFSSHRVTVAWRHSLMKRHENTRLCISDIIDPIDSKLHTYHKTPGLMTSTQKSWLKMTAPPGGNRKCLVFCMSYIWMYSSSPTARSHVKPYQMGLKTLIMKAYDYCDFSSNAILVAWRQSSSTRRDTRNYYNFGVGASTTQTTAPPCRHSYGFKEWVWQNNWLAPPIVQPRHYDWTTCTKIDRDMCLFITNK